MLMVRFLFGSTAAWAFAVLLAQVLRLDMVWAGQ